MTTLAVALVALLLGFWAGGKLMASASNTELARLRLLAAGLHAWRQKGAPVPPMLHAVLIDYQRLFPRPTATARTAWAGLQQAESQRDAGRKGRKVKAAR